MAADYSAEAVQDLQDESQAATDTAPEPAADNSEADTPSSRQTRADSDKPPASAGTRVERADILHPNHPRARDCNKPAERPNSSPNHPNPTAG